MGVQELKGKILVKGKRLNKLDAAFNAKITTEDEDVSEEDEAAEITKENGEKHKSTKVCWILKNQINLVDVMFAA